MFPTRESLANHPPPPQLPKAVSLKNAQIASFTNVDQCPRAPGRARFLGGVVSWQSKHASMKPLARWPLVFCESLLIALNELKINSEQETRDLLIDVVATHNEANFTRRRPIGIRRWWRSSSAFWPARIPSMP